MVEAQPETITRGPEYQLFDAGAVGLAAFVCSPLAGTILLAVNYVRLGKTGKGVLAVVIGLAANLGIVTPQRIHTTVGNAELCQLVKHRLIPYCPPALVFSNELVLVIPTA